MERRFKKGDVDPVTGRVFNRYRRYPSGTVTESWLSPEAFANAKRAHDAAEAIRRKTPEYKRKQNERRRVKKPEVRVRPDKERERQSLVNKFLRLIKRGFKPTYAERDRERKERFAARMRQHGTFIERRQRLAELHKAFLSVPSVKTEVSRIKENKRLDSKVKGRRRRRGRQRLNGKSKFDRKVMRELVRTTERLTACTGITFHLDHIVPLSRGGEHTCTNLRPLPATLNQYKSARLDSECDLPDCW